MPRPNLDEDYGEPIKYDPTFRGPQHRRTCTDVYCLFAFIAFLFVWAAVSGYAILSGDVRRLLVPTDTIGRKCGLDPGVEDKPFLVFFDMKKCLNSTVSSNGCPTTQVCVSKCPNDRLLYSEIENDSSADWNALKSKILCTSETDLSAIINKKSLLNHLDDKRCARDVFPSKSISKRCFPSNYTDLAELNFMSLDKEDIKDSIDVLSSVNQISTKVIEDLVSMKWWIFLSLVLVMLLCLIYITLLRWMAAPIIWFSIIGLIALICVGIIGSYMQYAYYQDHPAQIVSGDSIKAATQSILADKTTWLVTMIIACILLVIVLVVVFFLRTRINLAISLIKEGSKAVSSIKSTLFFPVFPWIFQMLALALGGVVYLYLTSIGTPIYKAYGNNETECFKNCGFKDGDICEPKSFSEICSSKCEDAVCHFSEISNPYYVYFFQGVNLVGYFWLTFFIEGLVELILAGAFATWYWTFKKSDMPFFTLSSSIKRSFRYNLGTVALGSFIITLCHLMRLLLEYIDYKIRKYDSRLSRFFMCCMQLFFKLLEKFLKFINKNAYILCAVHGKGLLGSAKDAFKLLMRNIMRVYVLDKVADFLFFLSKFVVAIACGAIAYWALPHPATDIAAEEQLHYRIVAPIIIGIAAYLISSVFFSVYSMAVDTLFLCFLEDCERNDGSPEKPYFMSKQLMEILSIKDDKLI